MTQPMTSHHMPASNSPSRKRGVGRRTSAPGTAMIEMVLVLPLLFVLIALLLFFGREWVRMQDATSMDRYEAWRQAEHATGPGVIHGDDAQHLNAMFFAGQASAIHHHHAATFPPDATDELAFAAGDRSADAANLVDALVATLPTGHRVTMSTEQPEQPGIWTELQGPIRHQHLRIANNWRFVNGITFDDGQWRGAGPQVTHQRAVRDAFLDQPLDQVLADEADRDIQLAQALRNLYLHTPGYAGPDVPREWVDD